eukprot:m51a1_g2425 hypothetical protein (1175) ;mRNA; f:815855-826879
MMVGAAPFIPSGYQSEWGELQCVSECNIPITAVHFDDLHEMVWAGYDSGRVVSFHSPSMERCCAFQVSPEPIQALIPDEYGLFALTPSCLRHFSKGGFPHLTVSSEQFKDMQCAALVGGGTQPERVVVGGAESILDIDLASGRVVLNAPMPQPVVAMSKGRNSVFCATTAGTVCVLDTRSMQITSRMEAHPGGVSAIDSSGDLIVTCGYTKRHSAPPGDASTPIPDGSATPLSVSPYRMGQVYVDPYLKLIDIRKGRTLTPVLVPNGPTHVKFHPSFSSTIIVVTQDAQFRVADVLGDVAGSPQQQIETACAAIGAVDVATTGEAVAFGDSAGVVRVWSDRDEPRVSTYSQPFDVTDTSAPDPSASADDWDSTPLCAPMPDEEECDGRQLASTWEPSLSFPVPMPRRPLDQLITPLLKPAPMGQLLQLSGLTRNQIQALRVTHPEIAMRLLESQREVQGNVMRPVKMYRRVEVKQKQGRVKEFNFGSYNRSPFCGLDNNLPNSYTNAILQTLYFIPQLRSHLLNHLCSREFCLACEAAFLFHALDMRGPVQSARNFFRALRQIPQASALKLLEKLPGAAVDPDTAAMGEGFTQFVLEQLHKELSTSTPAASKFASMEPPVTMTEPTGIVDTLFGCGVVTKSRCLNCGATSQRVSRALTHELTYGKAKVEIKEGKRPSFAKIVEASLSKQMTTKAWCEPCKHYQQTEQLRAASSLPSILCLCTKSSKETDIWPSLLKQSQDPDEAPWVPYTLQIRLSPEGAVNVEALPQNAPAAEDVYYLTSVMCHITDCSPKVSKSGSLVAHVNVPYEYLERRSFVPQGCEPGSPQWYLFNDFRITNTNAREPLRFDSVWKCPCVITYTKSTLQGSVPCPAPVNPIMNEVFYNRTLLNRASVIPVKLTIPASPSMLPKRGDVVAVDCEFVSLSAEEVVTELDGTRVVVTPAHLSPARVSCVFGENPFRGEPLIDDYVYTPEPISDYLTRFSGVEPGDLDPAISQKRLTTLKSVYLRLRYLVDCGCIFVGHGIGKDFRILNLPVPQEQVVDTSIEWVDSGSSSCNVTLLASTSATCVPSTYALQHDYGSISWWCTEKSLDVLSVELRFGDRKLVVHYLPCAPLGYWRTGPDDCRLHRVCVVDAATNTTVLRAGFDHPSPVELMPCAATESTVVLMCASNHSIIRA